MLLFLLSSCCNVVFDTCEVVFAVAAIVAAVTAVFAVVVIAAFSGFFCCAIFVFLVLLPPICFQYGVGK